MEDRYLFRAKRSDNGEWVIGNLITNVFFRLGQSIPYILCPDKAEYDCFEDFTEENGIFEVRPDTICQCTGLRDKHGKLIWENDILDGFTYPYVSDGVHNYYVEVCWCTNVPSFCIYTQKYPEAKVAGISAGNIELMADWNSNDWEVIGNIFDNKELLESEE